MRVGKGPIILTSRDRKALEAWVDRPGVPLQLIIRAWIILLSSSGHATDNVASRLGVSVSTVLYWRNRFLSGGITEISDDKKIKKPRHSDDEIRTIIEATKKQFPANARRWSIRNMAKLMGVSRSTIQRIWKRHGLKPFQDEFKLQHDPQFYEKCADLAGLYIESDHTYAVALLVDRVGLSASPAPESESSPTGDPHLIANVLRVVSRGRTRIQKPEVLDYLKWIDSHTPLNTRIHLIVPRRSLTLYPHAFRWLKRHPRFQIYVIPKEMTARSFLEEWYTRTESIARTQKSFPNLPDLQKSLNEFSAIHSKLRPAFKRIPVSKPFVWLRQDRNYMADERQLELDLPVVG